MMMVLYMCVTLDLLAKFTSCSSSSLLFVCTYEKSMKNAQYCNNTHNTSNKQEMCSLVGNHVALILVNNFVLKLKQINLSCVEVHLAGGCIKLLVNHCPTISISTNPLYVHAM